MTQFTRRAFLAASAAALPLSLGARPAAADETRAKPPVCVFSKHLEFLAYPELAKTCRELGLDGVDLTVRAGGHVLPENVARDLPRAVEAIRAEGLDVPMITTRLHRGNDPDARPILEAASALGIPYFRIGGHKYRARGNPREQFSRIARDLSGLAELAAEFGMTAGYHNHSGPLNVGAPLWDLEAIYGKVGSPRIGSNFDVGHATAEGPFGNWGITARLLAPHVKMMAVKDFVFDGVRPRWVPLGEGVVNTAEFLSIFREENFNGPISIHVEYRTEGQDGMIAEIGRAIPLLRGYIEEAGYA